MAEMKLYNKDRNENFFEDFYFKKDSDKNRKDCRQCMIIERKEWKSNNYEEAKSFRREYFQQKKKLLKKELRTSYE